MSDHDPVEYPAHYALFGGEHEVIDLIRDRLTADELRGYYLGNIYKYLCRHRYKGGAEDLRKAYKYLGWLVGDVTAPTSTGTDSVLQLLRRYLGDMAYIDCPDDATMEVFNIQITVADADEGTYNARQVYEDDYITMRQTASFVVYDALPYITGEALIKHYGLHDIEHSSLRCDSAVTFYLGGPPDVTMRRVNGEVVAWERDGEEYMTLRDLLQAIEDDVPASSLDIIRRLRRYLYVGEAHRCGYVTSC